MCRLHAVLKGARRAEASLLLYPTQRFTVTNLSRPISVLDGEVKGVSVTIDKTGLDECLLLAQTV